MECESECVVVMECESDDGGDGGGDDDIVNLPAQRFAFLAAFVLTLAQRPMPQSQLFFQTNACNNRARRRR